MYFRRVKSHLLKILVNPRVLNWKQIRLALALLDQLLIDAGLQLEATHATTISGQIDQHKQTLRSP